MNATNKTPSASDQMIAYLAAKGKKARKAGTATTEELAAVIGKSVKYTYDRLFWLAKRENRLMMTGSGKSAVWRSVPKARKGREETAEEALRRVEAAAQAEIDALGLDGTVIPS